MGLLFTFLGALIPTFFLSRLFLWASRNRLGGLTRVTVANVLAGIISCVLAGFGAADGGPFNLAFALLYIPAQSVWFVIDIYRDGKAA